MPQAIPGPNTGLVRVVSNSQLVQMEQAEKMKQQAEREQAIPVVQGLAGYVMRCWEAARDTKSEITTRLLKAQHARKGEYEASKLAAIKALGGSEEYARITDNKCRIAEAWLRDVYLGQSEQPWSLNPTPDPELLPDDDEQIREIVSGEIIEAGAMFQEPPTDAMIQSRLSELEDAAQERIREKARKTSERMERKMHDQLVQGNWESQWGKFINDLTTYPAAHFKGPIFRNRREVKWMETPEGWRPQVVETVAMEWMRIDPFRAYPSPNATTPQEGYFIEHVTYSKKDLYDLIQLGPESGYNERAIRGALSDYERGLTNWLGFAGVDQQERNLEGQDRDRGPVIDIDGLEFHGPVSGRDLLTWGLDKSQVPDIDANYEATVWLVGRWVIKAQLNYDPTETRPIYKACWQDVPGGYWGQSLVDTLSDVQGIVNAGVRALVNNMGMASGPQVAINVDRLPPGMQISTLTPWKIWQFNDSEYGSTQKAIEFFQPEANFNALITVIEKFYQFADDWSLIPRYMSGNDRVGGPARTASGLSMLLNAANKGLKGIVSGVDTEVLTPMLEKLYTYNMLFDPDETIKGDAKVMARGAVSLMQLETLQLRRNEFLVATNNPVDQQITGIEGRAEVLRSVAKDLDIDINRVIPPRTALQNPQQNMALPPPGNAPQSNEQLMNGAATTDNFSPNALRAVA